MMSFTFDCEICKKTKSIIEINKDFIECKTNDMICKECYKK